MLDLVTVVAVAIAPVDAPATITCDAATVVLAAKVVTSISVVIVVAAVVDMSVIGGGGRHVLARGRRG